MTKHDITAVNHITCRQILGDLIIRGTPFIEVDIKNSFTSLENMSMAANVEKTITEQLFVSG